VPATGDGIGVGLSVEHPTHRLYGVGRSRRHSSANGSRCHRVTDSTSSGIFSEVLLAPARRARGLAVSSAARVAVTSAARAAWRFAYARRARPVRVFGDLLFGGLLPAPGFHRRPR